MLVFVFIYIYIYLLHFPLRALYSIFSLYFTPYMYLFSVNQMNFFFRFNTNRKSESKANSEDSAVCHKIRNKINDPSVSTVGTR